MNTDNDDDDTPLVTTRKPRPTIVRAGGGQKFKLLAKKRPRNSDDSSGAELETGNVRFLKTATADKRFKRASGSDSDPSTEDYPVTKIQPIKSKTAADRSRNATKKPHHDQELTDEHVRPSEEKYSSLSVTSRKKSKSRKNKVVAKKKSDSDETEDYSSLLARAAADSGKRTDKNSLSKTRSTVAKSKSHSSDEMSTEAAFNDQSTEDYNLVVTNSNKTAVSTDNIDSDEELTEEFTSGVVRTLTTNSKKATKRANSDGDSTDEDSLVLVKARKLSMANEKCNAVEEKKQTPKKEFALQKRNTTSKFTKSNDGESTDDNSHIVLINENRSSLATINTSGDSTDEYIPASVKSKAVPAKTSKFDKTTDYVNSTNDVRSSVKTEAKIILTKVKVASKHQESDEESTDDYSPAVTKSETKNPVDSRKADDESTDDCSLAAVKAKSSAVEKNKLKLDNDSTSNKSSPRSKVMTKKADSDSEDTEYYHQSPIMQPSRLTITKTRRKRLGYGDESEDDFCPAAVKPKQKTKSTRKVLRNSSNSEFESMDESKVLTDTKKRAKSEDNLTGNHVPTTVKAKSSSFSTKTTKMVEKTETDSDATDPSSPVRRKQSRKTKVVVEHPSSDDESTDDFSHAPLKPKTSENTKVLTLTEDVDDNTTPKRSIQNGKNSIKKKYSPKFRESDDDTTDDDSQMSKSAKRNSNPKTQNKSNPTVTKTALSEESTGSVLTDYDSELVNSPSKKVISSQSDTGSDSEGGSVSEMSSPKEKVTRKVAGSTEELGDSSTDDRNYTKKTTKQSNRGGDENDKRLDRMKRYIHTAGLRVHYKKILDGIRSHKGRLQRLEQVLRDAGLKGRPTLESCKRLKKTRETKKEVAELDLGNILESTSGRCHRSSVPFPQQKQKSPSKAIKKIFSRLKAIADSDASSD